MDQNVTLCVPTSWKDSTVIISEGVTTCYHFSQTLTQIIKFVIMKQALGSFLAISPPRRSYLFAEKFQILD